MSFRPQNVTLDQMTKPLYQTRSQKVSDLLNWDDRRPIGSIIAANSNTGYPTNPRGWFNDRQVNITTSAGKRAFETRMLSFADNCVTNLKNVGAQGMIFWDVEGEEYPHATTYLGDPRVLPQAAPEMDAIADRFFAKFRAAGLRTGLTLRPSRVVRASNGKLTHNHMNFDVVDEISDKIDYAQNRWGCTLFYVDSNATYAYADNNNVTSWIMRAEMFRELARRHPDCLLIPEHNTFDYWSATAPYQELRSDNFGTPDNARLAYPGAFSVINIADGDLKKYQAALKQDTKNGDVLLFRCWFNDGTHDQVKDLSQSAPPPAAPRPAPEEPTTAPEVEPDFENEIIVDNQDAGAFFEGDWKTSGASSGFYNRDYAHDNNKEKDAKSVRFRPNLPRAGRWEVYARWSSHSNRASNAPYDVIDAQGQTTTVCNQRTNGGKWISLGRHVFKAGTGGSVLLRNDNTNGYVIADAVKWVWVGDDTASAVQAPDAAPAINSQAPSANAS